MSSDIGQMDRRKLLASIAGASGVALTGCLEDGDGGGGDDDGDGGGDLGERVPEINVEWWSDVGASSNIMEAILETMSRNWSELGLEANSNPREALVAQANARDDQRTSAVHIYTHSSPPDRLDPNEFMLKFTADTAGNTGQNETNWADCEYTHLAHEQSRLTDEDERREVVNEAQVLASEAINMVPLVPRLNGGAYLDEKVEVGGVGAASLIPTNPNWYRESTPLEGNEIVTHDDPALTGANNFATINTPRALAIWNHLVHSPLTAYDSDFELENVLADSVEYSDDGEQLVVELIDSTFHNGDPVTAEDVQWTYEHINEYAGPVYTAARSMPLDSIDIVDDRTVEFNFTEPTPTATTVTFPRWGVFHKDTWVDGGAEDDPEDFEFGEGDPGSGPFEIGQLRGQEFLQLEPFNDHAVYDIDHTVTIQIIRDIESAYQAFQNEEIDMLNTLGPGQLNQVEEEMSDRATTIRNEEIAGFYLYPQHTMAPIKFREFRLAIARAIDRREIAEVAMFGGVEPDTYPTVFTRAHPWRAPEEDMFQVTDDPAGDIEGAREALEEEGWGWDGDGNLHYPPDADLSPPWPEGETPDPDDFPCLDEEGNYTPE